MSRRPVRADHLDRRSDEMWVVVAPEATRASIEAAVRQVDGRCEPALVSFAWTGQDHGHDRPGVFVKAGPVLVWAVDPYEGERLDWALYGSELGCRLGDD